ncbi:hypothetical protein BDD12DRAFT_876209 [Trichophaea hybrida]|nr:hypothetical protein BDD12DRAFT_876209 [Trichophaea hybrida]
MVTVNEVGDFGGMGDIQVFDITNKRVAKIRIITVYNQTLQEHNNRPSTRPAREARWDEMIAEGNMVVRGDFNGDSPWWNSGCDETRNTSFSIANDLTPFTAKHTGEIFKAGASHSTTTTTTKPTNAHRPLIALSMNPYIPTSHARVQRKVTEAKWKETDAWWKAKFNSNEKIAGRYFQLKVGHVLTGVYLERIKKNESPECWWCGHKRQTREHLFKRCPKWRKQQDELERRFRKKCKWKDRAKVEMAQVFDSEDAVKSVLKFLKGTDVGNCSGEREGTV